MDSKILIGTVAEIYGISKQTLIYYDKIGLLSPSDTEDNNYRYYSYEQIDMLDVILSLKETGMHLKEIQSYLENRSLQQGLELLKKQTVTIEKQIEHLSNIQIKLNKRISRLEDFSELTTTNDVRKIHFSERTIIRIPVPNGEGHNDSMQEAVKILNQHSKTNQNLTLYSHLPFCCTLSKENLLSQNYHEIKSIFKEIESFIDSPYLDLIPANTYICYYHYGRYEDVGSTYKYLAQYLTTHDLTVIGDGLEIPRVDAWSVTNESDYITEIQIPIAES